MSVVMAIVAVAVEGTAVIEVVDVAAVAVEGTAAIEVVAAWISFLQPFSSQPS